jgi:hyperosmotically inducible protein
MRLLNTTKASAFALALFLGPLWAAPQSADTKPKPDNTATNKGDQDPGAVTADKQKMNPADRDLTAKIRKSVMADKSLSTYAHNVKIVSQNGIVTLKGPVRSDDEAKAIVAKATEIAGGAANVVNQMTVQPESK